MLSEIEKKLLGYLKEQVRSGKMYYKSKHIAKDIGESPKCVGTTLFWLSKNPDVKGIEIKPWSESISTTWRIVRV